ncbi:cytochrome P450 monooxygenase [Heliocybe sulcata]|uniref:Cytochrome P450 monooxygenase n=1 Tax=Heliocybe sulcata TaxID=5364 RepID=A0A5C3NL97_9AGAM|nr:cytochrome P450 monooxygenase [Heliocybe sulcata]
MSSHTRSIANETHFLKALKPDRLSIVLVGLVVAYYIALYFRQKARNYAPGPTPWPIVGNYVPTEKSWLFFHDLCKKYGPIVRLSLAGNEMLILDDLEDVEELLGKRSSNYSSRRQLTYSGKYRSIDKRLVLLPYGPLLKKQRAAAFQMLNARAVGGYEGIQERGSIKLVTDILKQPTKAYISIKWYTAETLQTLVYAKRFSEDGNDLKTLLHVLETFIQDMHPARYPVDNHPILDKLPDALSPWRAEAKEKHDYEFTFYRRLLREVKQRMDNGENLECFAARLWEDVEKNALDETSMAYLAGSAFEAGTDNTAGTVLWALVAILNYPETMKKAQAEIDRVLGKDANMPPSFKHFEDLTYCTALVKEVFRWSPVAPVSAPHQSLQDDVYKGYFVPAGTTVVPNIWAIHHNEKHYPEPFLFNPERFMPKNGEKLGTESLNEGHCGFGFGRRVCPGQYLASKSVWMGIVTLLWGFDILPPTGANGKPILPDPSAVRNGLTAEPDAFDVVMKPRRAIDVDALTQAWAN